MKRTMQLGMMVLITIVISCGGNPQVRDKSKKDPYVVLGLIEGDSVKVDMSRPAEPVAAVLWKYSPEAYILVRRAEMMHGDIYMGKTPVHLSDKASSKTTIMDNKGNIVKETVHEEKGMYTFIDRSKPVIEQVKQLYVSVHELNHRYTHMNALYLLSKKLSDSSALNIRSDDGKKLYTSNYDSYYFDRNTSLYSFVQSVNYAKKTVFPASRLDGFIPESKRTSRYKTYIQKGSVHSAQYTGISALLDEYHAYYWSVKVIYDLYDYYKNECPQNQATWLSWTEPLFANYFAWAEFRYYILSYLLYAEKNEPSVFSHLMRDTQLRRVFTEIDDNFNGLMSKVFVRLTDELPRHLESQGIKFSTQEGRLILPAYESKEPMYHIGSGWSTMFLVYFNILLPELNSAEYVRIGNAFRLAPQGTLPELPQAFSGGPK